MKLKCPPIFFFLIKKKKKGCILQWLPSLHTYVAFTSFFQIKFHGPWRCPVPADVPDSTVSGITISEKLRDIYIKNMLFNFHIGKLEEYQKKPWGNPQSIEGPLSRVKIRLAYFLDSIKTTLLKMDPEISLPTTPAPPLLSHARDYAKKVYGWCVLSTLKDWLTQVLQVIEAKEVYDGQQGQSWKVWGNDPNDVSRIYILSAILLKFLLLPMTAATQSIQTCWTILNFESYISCHLWIFTVMV